MRRREFLVFATALGVARGADILPLAQVRAGQRGVGRTVFSGDQVEEFQAQILGVLDNVGPKQSLILARLSGGPLQQTGVMAGMSGSPVYVDGKLIGAVAFSFPFTTEPLCGIRPIEDMLAPETPAPERAAAPSLQALLSGEQPLLPATPRSAKAEGMVPIATPVSFGGFTERTLDIFGDRLRALGLRPVQGVGGQARGAAAAGPLEPGAMISVGLIEGDLSVSAAGTVTAIEGDRIQAFGHPFLSAGPARLPMARASVITLVPNLQNSFKLAATGQQIGAITLDRTAGVAGIIGGDPDMAPAGFRVNGRDYRMTLVRDPYLTPFLLEMAAFSAVDATERQLGPSTLRVNGRATFVGDVPDLDLGDVYSGPTSVSQQAALNTAAPLAFVMQAAGERLRIENIEIEVSATPEQRTLRVARVWTDRETVKRGETVRLFVLLRDGEGHETLHSDTVMFPAHTQAGEVFLTVSDAAGLNMSDLSLLFDRGGMPAGRLIEAVNRLRRSDRYYTRAWRLYRGLHAQGQRFEQPPASLLAVLDAPRGAAGGAAADPFTTLEERASEPVDAFVQGSETLRLTVTE
ncbi:MAG: SpoIVB peptidase S55 domain-containing protein [Bryobacterales bacterium]